MFTLLTLIGCSDLGFLERLPEVRELIASDVEAAYVGDPAARSMDEIIFCYPGLEAITVYRLAKELLQRGVPFVPRMMTVRILLQRL